MLVLLLCAAGGCSRTHTSDEGEYLAWLNNPENGLVQVRTANGFRIAVKYLPPDYRAYRELRAGGSQDDHATVEKRAASSVAVLLSISPDTTQVLKERIDPQAMIQQGLMLNEDIKQHLSLRADGARYTPVITTLDNDAGMSGTINITALFIEEPPQGKLLDAGQYDVVFDDEMFGTGISHFLFSHDAIESRLRFEY